MERSTGDGPIFIGGLDKSGKTLLRLMLSSHPDIAITRRTNLWTRYYRKYGDLRDRNNFQRCIEAIFQQESMRFLNLNPEWVKKEFWQGETTYARLFSIIYRQFSDSLGKKRWGDQLALIERYAEDIFSAYPQAKIIHMIRDPRQRYREGIRKDSRRAGKAGRETAQWLYSTSLGRKNQQTYPSGYRCVRYELLIAQPELTLREVCEFIGEDYDPAMITMENAYRFGASEAGNKKSGERLAPGGEEEISLPHGLSTCRDEIFIQSQAKQMMQIYGYIPDSIKLSAWENLLYWLVDWPVNLAAVCLWGVLLPRRLH
jgi:hypothetical protein